MGREWVVKYMKFSRNFHIQNHIMMYNISTKKEENKMKHSKIETVRTFELWTTIVDLGTFEDDYKNGELWSFNGKLYYLSHMELKPEVLRELLDFYKEPERVG